jgi:hypothetical protein
MRRLKGGILFLFCLGIVTNCAGSGSILNAKEREYPAADPSRQVNQSTSEETIGASLSEDENPHYSSLFDTSSTTVYLPAIFNHTGGFPPIPAEEFVWSMLKQVDLTRALADLKRLSGEEQICTISGCNWILNRSTGSEGLRWAKEYVYAEFSELGYQVEYQEWSRSGYNDQMILVRKPGVQLAGEEIYLVAHLDGVDKADSDRFPAADDNGSGVVSILELARVFSHYTFSRTLVLLISTGEENGTLGVLKYLENLSPGDMDAISKVINIDMIGYDANHDQVMNLWHGGHPPSKAFAQSMKETIQFYELDLVPELAIGCG